MRVYCGKGRPALLHIPDSERELLTEDSVSKGKVAVAKPARNASFKDIPR